MLEDLAFSFINQSETELAIWGLSLTFLGFVLALLRRRNSTWSLYRVPYFISIAGLFALYSVLSLAWLSSFEAVKAGVLWVLVTAIFIAVVAFGYVFGATSHARSVNGYGNGRSAWMGFLPILNLALMLKPPLHKKYENRTVTRTLGNMSGIILGLLLFSFSHFTSQYSEYSLNNMKEKGESDTKFQYIYTESMIRIHGLERTLSDMAHETASQQVDEITVLLRMEASGSTLKYIYRVDTDSYSLSNSVRRRILHGTCETNVLEPAMNSGATIEHHYWRSDGTEIGTVMINKVICEKLEHQQSTTLTEAEISNLIDGSAAGAMYRALKRYFPEEAKYLRDNMVSVAANGGSEEETFAKMYAVGEDIRRRHAAKLRSAPDSALSEILHFQSKIIETFEDDPVMCNRIVMLGLKGVKKDQRDRILPLMDSVWLLFRAMHEGGRSPVQRTVPTDEDWQNLFNDFYADGGTESELNVIVQPDIQNPQLCGAMQRLFHVLANAKFPGSDRLRAEMAVAINES